MLVGVTPLLYRPVIKGDPKLKTANEWGVCLNLGALGSEGMLVR